MTLVCHPELGVVDILLYLLEIFFFKASSEGPLYQPPVPHSSIPEVTVSMQYII